MFDVAHVHSEGDQWLAEFPDAPGCQTFSDSMEAPEASLSAALCVRWARQDLGMTQTELARRVGVSPRQIAKLENPDEDPTLRSLDQVAKGLGRQLNISLVRRAG